MSNKTLTISAKVARRLVVTKQHLAGKLPSQSTGEDILSIVRDLSYVQWDPISILAPSHVISLWSRLGDFRLSDLDRMMWEKKKLFLYWTPIASIVLSEDYPLYYSLMRRYPDSLSNSWGAQRDRAKKFLGEHKPLMKAVLSELKKQGPLSLTQFRDYVQSKRSSDGWTPGNMLSLMLFHLLMSGKVMVVGHQGNQNVWGLSEEFLPSWVERKELPEQEVELMAAQRAIRALGMASASEINYYFVRGRYQNLGRALKRLQDESVVHRVVVTGLPGREERYIHDDDIALLESMDTDAWQPRLSLLAPFDNLIYGRTRTSRVFGFDYVHEQFLPKNKRKFGTYVLPILWGERLVGRIDPRLDKEKQRLVINSVHAEEGATTDRELSEKIGEAVDRFATFLGMKEVFYAGRVPSAWRSSLH
ncbi:MAG: YcaQ family DNA glycosylase [Nitrososphaerota archaeon]|nr:YcaQ family DNA glycosylase [Nitrososphaerota archaeon]